MAARAAAAARLQVRALFHRIGIEDDLTRDELEFQGIRSIANLADLSEDDIKSVVINVQKYPHDIANGRPYLNAVSIEKLKVVHYWIQLRVRSGLVYHAPLCTIPQINVARERMRELKAIEKAERDRKVEAPKTLMKWSEWREWWDKVLTYLHTIRGAADIPIVYVFRADDEVTDEALAAT
ncbi:MAG: hypothetical protein SGILL_002555 [Bacillariaceae sp.]